MSTHTVRECVTRIAYPESAYAAHRAVWDAVVRGECQPAPFLFRVRPASQQGEALVKIRSVELPPAAPEVPRPQAGARYRFDVLVHPVRRFSGSSERPIVRESAVRAWLTERLANAGMRLESATIQSPAPWRLGKRGHGRAWLHVAEARGELAVLDAALAMRGLTEGIGRARRFGFGLLELDHLEPRS